MTRPHVRRTTAVAAVTLGTAAAALLMTAPSASAAALPAPTPSSIAITPGESFSLSGTGCVMQQGGFADVYVAAPSTFEGAVVAGSDGSWTMHVDVLSNLPAGSYQLEVTCGFYAEQYSYPPVTVTVGATGTTTSATPTATVTVTRGVTHVVAAPGQSLTPGKAAAPGQKFQLTFPGYTPGERTTWELHSTPRSLGAHTADASGQLVSALTIPSDVPAGDHELRVTRANGTVVSYPIRVAAARSLAYTGSDVSRPLGIGVGCLAAGAALVLVGRRRRAGAPQA